MDNGSCDLVSDITGHKQMSSLWHYNRQQLEYQTACSRSVGMKHKFHVQYLHTFHRGHLDTCKKLNLIGIIFVIKMICMKLLARNGHTRNGELISAPLCMLGRPHTTRGHWTIKTLDKVHDAKLVYRWQTNGQMMCRDWNFACCIKHAWNRGIGHFNTQWEITWKIT